jgi:hypothetical protein
MLTLIMTLAQASKGVGHNNICDNGVEFFIFNNKLNFHFTSIPGKDIIFLQNVGTYLQVNTAQNPIILLSSDI